MPLSDRALRLSSGSAAAFSVSDLMSAMTSGRSILVPNHFHDEAAAWKVVNELWELSRYGSGPVAMILSGDSADYTSTMLLLDHVRMSTMPILGVAATSIGALRTALLQGCTYRFARREATFALALQVGWTEASITLRAGVDSADLAEAMERAAARKLLRLSAVGSVLAARSNVPSSEWVHRITSAVGASVDEALDVGLIDAIVD